LRLSFNAAERYKIESRIAGKTFSISCIVAIAQRIDFLTYSKTVDEIPSTALCTHVIGYESFAERVSGSSSIAKFAGGSTQFVARITRCA
jgi:hypothetical protein